MSSADDIQAMLDDVYAISGVPAAWTPVGGAPLAFTGMLFGGDQAAQIHGVTVEMNMQAVGVKARAAELAALSPTRTPADGDAVALLDDLGNVIQAYIVAGAPRREDPRRLEWTLDLAEG